MLLSDSRAVIFQITGRLNQSKPISTADLLSDFRLAFFEHCETDESISTVEDIFKAFIRLNRRTLEEKKRLYIFFDELPWLAQASPEFYSQFSSVWNNIFEKYSHVKVFLTGSATSWMINHVINAKEGLAKRITQKIYLQPFLLGEVKSFLEGKNLSLSTTPLLELYSAIGGIPYYLNALDPSISVRENLYHLLIDKDGLLRGDDEYLQLFRYLFHDYRKYSKLVNIVGSKCYGLSLNEISKQFENRTTPSGNLRLHIKNLIASNILEKKTQFLNQKRGQYLFVQDEYIRFHTKWLNQPDGHISYPAFNALFESHSYRSWSGFNFELICSKHIDAIKQALSISGIGVRDTLYYRDQSIQIDILLDRNDQVITVCEAKHYSLPYEPTQADVQNYLNRKAAIEHYLKEKKKAKKSVNYCFITTNGIKKNKHFSAINPLHVSMDDIVNHSTGIP